MSSQLRGRAAAAVRSAVPAALIGLAVWVLVPASVGSSIGAVFAIGLATGVLTVGIFGLETTAVFLLLVAYFFAPMDDVRPIPALDIVATSDVFLLLGILMLVPLLLTKSFEFDGLFIAGVLGMIAAISFGVMASEVPIVSLILSIRLFIGALLLPIVFLWWRPGLRMAVLLACAYVLGNVVNGVYAVTIGPTTLYDNRVVGFTTHPNVIGLGAMLGFALLPFLFSFGKHRWAVGVAALVCFSSVWFSGSRAALVVTAAIVVVYPILARSVEAAIAVCGVGVIAAYVVADTIMSGEAGENALGRIFGGGSAQASTQVREAHAKAALQDIADRPVFGQGLTETTLDTHNIYLQVMQAGGVIMLVSFLLVLVAVTWRAQIVDRRASLLMICGLAYALIGPLTPLLWDRYIWCVLALTMLMSRRGPDDEPIDASSPVSVGTARPDSAN